MSMILSFSNANFSVVDLFFLGFDCNSNGRIAKINSHVEIAEMIILLRLRRAPYQLISNNGYLVSKCVGSNPTPSLVFYWFRVI